MGMKDVVKIKKVKTWKYIIFYLLLLPVLFPPGNSEIFGREIENTGYKYFKNYSYLDYDHHQQNFCITQDANGLIYVGNRGGILIYDGGAWELIEIPNTPVLSLVMGADGFIYAGGIKEFGRLKPDSKGTLHFISLMDRIHDKYKNLSYARDLIAADDGVYFRTSNRLLRWNYKKETVDVFDQTAVWSLFSPSGRPRVQIWKRGLQKIVKDSLKPAPLQLLNNKLLEETRIRMLVPYGKDTGSHTFLLGTGSKGFFLYNENTGSLEPFHTEADDYLEKNRIYHGIRLSSGDFAAAVQYGGLVIFDSSGQVKYTFNKSSGLQDNGVNFVFEDNGGNVWLALNNGISRLEYRSPFYHYDDRYGLEGTALTIARFRDDLYVGTTQGIFVLPEGDESFTPIPGSPVCLQLVPVGTSLLTAAADGLYEIKKRNKIGEKIFPGKNLEIAVSSRFPGVLWCTAGEKLAVLSYENKRWAKKYTLNTFKNDLKHAVEDPDGYLWLFSITGEIFKIEFPQGIDRPLTTVFHLEDLTYRGEIFPAVIENHVVFATSNGLFRFDKTKQSLLPETLLGDGFAGGPAAKPVFRIVQDESRCTWFHSASMNYRALPPAIEGNPFEIDGMLFRRLPPGQVNAIYPEPNGKHVWFACASGIIRFDCEAKTTWQKEFPALVRKVFVNETGLIFGGRDPIPHVSAFPGAAGSGVTGTLPDEEVSRDPGYDRTGIPGTSPGRELFYSERNIFFHCAAPFFEKESAIEFRYALDGYNPLWSQWTGESQRHYTNLDAGRYNFRVQARNIYGDISSEDSFSFRVLPPWYQTWWAFTLYAAGLLLLFYLALKWRSRKLVREKERLEQVVKERTREVRDKNEQLQRQTVQLREQSEKLKEMDKIKSRFFTNLSHEFRTPLTLVMSPLEQLLSRSRDYSKKKIYRVMLRNLQMLLSFINQLLDLSRIDSGKMKLQASYRDVVPLLKGVIASFRMLADQKRLTLDFHCENEKIFLYYDNEKMEEVMYNLLSNAVKFTPPGGKVTVSASTLPTQIRISIKDTGVGIPNDQLSAVFERFSRTEVRTGEFGKGTGIGLALSKEFILLHHGNIDARSVEGKGTEFIVRLPMGKDHLTVDEIASVPTAASKSGKGKGIDRIRFDMEMEDETDAVPEGIETADGNEDEEKTIILVVEDHKDMRRHIRETLEPSYRVIEAADGKEGIVKAKEFIPDLIISDIMMPGADGYELCRRLKKEFATSHIPVILLTARASTDSVIRGLGTGADDYITKPFNTNMLTARIKNLIDLRRQMQLKIQRQKMLLPSEVSVSSQDDRFLKEFQAVIEKNLDNPDLNVDLLCDKLIIGRATLFRKVLALTGETPNQFIQSYRLERGAQMLRENYGNVTEVAFAVGYSSSQYFASCFKDKFHQSPKTFQLAESLQSRSPQISDHKSIFSD